MDQTRQSTNRFRRSNQPGRVTGRGQARVPQDARKNYERYMVLARASAQAGDQIEAEGFYQYAEHYLRSMAVTDSSRDVSAAKVSEAPDPLVTKT